MPAPNFYASGQFDRADHRRTDDQWLGELYRAPTTRYVPVWQYKSLFTDVSGKPEAVLLEAAEAQELASRGGERVFLGLDGEQAFVALDISALEQPDHVPSLAGRGYFADLRAVGPLLPREVGSLLAYARALIYWNSRHRFCGVCGAATASRHAGHQRLCTNPDCGTSHFPRTDPAVIMLVHDGGDRCVLGRQKVWPPGMHSTLAGFVEPGESLEAAVAREVEEEAGIVVSDVRYHSSQPWPFPCSLMLGFYARADFGRLQVQPQELESAGWFDRNWLLRSPEDETFKLPRKDSIARRLIEDWLAGRSV